MPVHTQEPLPRLSPGIRPVQEDIVRPYELGPRHDLNAHAQDVAAVHGVGVRVAHAEGGDAGAGAVQTLLIVRLLLFDPGLEVLRGFVRRYGLACRGGGEKGAGLDADLAFERFDYDCSRGGSK
ncbi:hypothetical protein VP1G_11335 [Cytospora mali]|uniref:Uncharacterized protein n=1 Tax=Cytospora mali TaxID=578113 RepID=A0A194VDQ7_CYTMA|nr:hypothetical protein VP1G_11335 [Valsa mali var. pyri (nom. inval.)]